MAYEEPDLPVSGNAVSTSGFGFKVRNSIIWLKGQVDALLAGALLHRQGGSAIDWSLKGNTNYTLTVPPLIQFGSKDVPYVNGTYAGSATLTFETAFAERPLVFVTYYGIDSYTGTLANVVYVGQIETTYATLRIKNDTQQASNWGQTVFWIAIGKAA